MRPYYVYTPYRRCDSFDLTVRFNPADPPATVWQLEEAVISVIESESPAGTLLVPDAFGEVHVRFSTLKTGLGYGLRWSTRPAD